MTQGPTRGSPIVETSAGYVRGVQRGATFMFRGVPYAAGTGGANRFQPPRPVSWAGVREAMDYGPRCEQIEPPTDVPWLSWLQDTRPASEDCLVLNVHTPSLDETSQLPVMVYVHGGAFRMSSGGTPGLDGANLASNGAVVVTVNHRLNLFGFLYLGECGDERYADSGNVGMLDLVAALEWIKRNIGRFGGDSGNVTLVGQSGGGSKVSVLMAMPKARGLFHKAVIQSASSLLRMATLEEASRNTHLFLTQLGLTHARVAALHDVSAATLLRAMPEAIRAAGRIDNFRPTVDGRNLHSQPFDAKALALSRHVPVMTGWCENEMRYFHLPRLATLPQDMRGAVTQTAQSLGVDDADVGQLLSVYASGRPNDGPADLYSQIQGDHIYRRSVTGAAERRAAHGAAPLYMYLLNWKSPVENGLLRTPHTLCIAFAFANVDVATGITGTSGDRYILQHQMSQAWLAFARSGNPNHAGLPAWGAWDLQQRSTMVFDRESYVANDPLREERLAMEPFPRHVPAEREGASA